MNNIKIDDMTKQDFDEIKNILISDFDDFWNVELLEKEILGENKKYIVAKQDKTIVGFAGILLIKPEMEIMNIVTKKVERSKGIGSLLLEKIIENAIKNNFERIYLEVNENNVIAKKLYKKFGFSEVGLRKNYYNNSENAIIMSKIL